MVGNTIFWSKPTKIAFGIFMALLIIGAFFYSGYVKNKGVREFDVFYATNIDGVISCSPNGSSAGTYFCVDSSKYNFHPRTAAINEGKIFCRFAELGDSIYKPAYADTLALIKNGKRYNYTFAK